LENQRGESQGNFSTNRCNCERHLQLGRSALSERGNNDERKFEVPSHQWFDLTDRSGAFGVTILSDCKYGSDKPDDKTLRLTLLRTPGIAPRPATRISQHRIGAGTRSSTVWRRMQVIGVAARQIGRRNDSINR
jgi:hypothetical protein